MRAKKVYISKEAPRVRLNSLSPLDINLIDYYHTFVDFMNKLLLVIKKTIK